MKKLMFAAAIAAVSAAFAIESQNIVGYSTQDLSAKEGKSSVYNIAGFCFANVGANAGEAKFSDLSATGWDWEGDELRILNPLNCSNDQTLIYLTEEEAKEFEVGTKAGWYDSTSVEYAGDLSVAPGAGFMTSLSSTAVQINMPAVSPVAQN